LSLYFSNGHFDANSDRYEWSISSMPTGYAIVRIISKDKKQTITFMGVMVIKEMAVE